MAAYGASSLAPNVPAALPATGYDVNTDVIVYPPAQLAPVGEVPPKAYVRGTDHEWHAVT